MGPPPQAAKPRCVAKKEDETHIDSERKSSGGVPHVQFICKPPRFSKVLAGPLGDVQPHVIALFRSSYEEASKHLESGLTVDYFALAHAFRERTNQGLLVITNILDDFSYYTKEVLDAELHQDKIPGPCSHTDDQYHSCEMCQTRRRMCPGDVDMENLQYFVTGLLNFTFQNFFHRLLWRGPGPIKETYDEALTPIHNMFRSFGQPTWDGWRESIMVYERQGSQHFKIPIHPEDAVPTGCPATLAYNDQNAIHTFIDRVLCHSQLLHEKHGVKVHHTTFLDNGLGYCAVCEVTASYFLPALVAPYLVLRQHRREQIGLDLHEALEARSTERCTTTLLELTSVPVEFNFPELKVPLPQKPKKRKSKKKKPKVTVEPNFPRYQSTLLPTSRAPFVPRQPADGIDKEKHPYSYFLSLTPGERKVYLKEKVNRTRTNMGYPPIQPDEDIGGGSWKCSWLSLAEVGENASDHIPPTDSRNCVLKDFGKLMEEKKSDFGAIHHRGPDREQSDLTELRGRNASTQVLEMATEELRKLSTDEVAQMGWVKRQNESGNVYKITSAGVTNDVLDMAIAHLARMQALATEAAKGTIENGVLTGEVQAKEQKGVVDKKRRKKKGKRKGRAGFTNIDVAADQA